MSKTPEDKKGGTKKSSDKKSSDRKSEARSSGRRPGPDQIETDRRGGPAPDARGRGRRGPRGPRIEGVGFDDESFGEPGGHGRHRGHRGGRGRGAPRARRGEVRNAVITSLAEGPKHGYQLIQEMTERSGGAWVPSPGSIYPILHRLAEAGVVEAEDKEDGRRIFRLTALGQVVADKLAQRGDAPWTTIGADESAEARALREVAVQFDGAVSQVAQVATADQLTRAAAIVAESRRRLYALLAEDPSSTPGSPEA